MVNATKVAIEDEKVAIAPDHLAIEVLRRASLICSPIVCRISSVPGNILYAAFLTSNHLFNVYYHKQYVSFCQQ